MQIFGNELVVHRGETFTLSYSLENKDGSPYVFTTRALNPYFLFTVSSAKYEQASRYIKNWWLKIPDEYRFYNTTAIEIADLTKDALDNAMSSITSDLSDDNLSKYSIYKVQNPTTLECKYYRYIGDGNFVEYKCTIVKSFTHTDTADWIGQNYVYELNYVDGELMSDKLRYLYTNNNLPDPIPSDSYALYTALVEYDSKYSSLKYDRILDVSIAIPIISTSKLLVLSNVKGGTF